MEKNTVLAIVLSVAVMSAFYLIQLRFFPPKNASQQEVAAPLQQNEPQRVDPVVQAPAGGVVQDVSAAASKSVAAAIPIEAPQDEQRVIIETPFLIVELTNSGGDIVSYKLKEHKEKQGVDSNVDMIFSGATDAHAFGIAFGGADSPPITSFFNVRRISDYSVEFYRDFQAAGELFRLTKLYNFKPNGYMFELLVSIDGGYNIPPLNFSGNGIQTAYTLKFGPQIGPEFEKLDERSDYRHYHTFINGKQRVEKISNGRAIVNSRFSWAAIAGKYFALIAVPDATQYALVFSTNAIEAGVNASSHLSLERPPLGSSRVTDTYRFYLGPKTQKALAIYDNGANEFGYTDMRMESLSNASGFWGILNPLEAVLKWLLTIFYKIVHNYGVAIILVTLLVKLILFPLTKKSSEGTIRMQTIAPKIKELQEKYKTNPQKMNMEMAALYKKENYSPLSGCLPMLIQIPIFLAMYNLFNNHFDLRGAMFIPTWIPDLSVPESILNFSPVRIPILGWSDLRLLPFIYVGSQLLYGRVTQTPDQTGNSQMKMMLYVMPILFFFVLYNVPSGLLIYWIMSNILTMGQQLIINKAMAKKRAEIAAANQPVQKNVIVPPKKRKKR